MDSRPESSRQPQLNDPELFTSADPTVRMLEYLASTVGVPFQPSHALSVLERVNIRVPGDWRDTWVDRLELAASELGLRIYRITLPLREAVRQVRPDIPLVIYSTMQQRWLVLIETRGRSVRIAGLQPGEPHQWLTLSELWAMIGATDLLEPLDWLITYRAAQIEMESPHAEYTSAAAGAAEEHDAHDADHAQHHGPPRPISRIIQILKPERGDILWVVVFAAAVGILSLATPIAIEALVNTVAFGVVMQPVIILAAALMFCLGLAAIIRAMQEYVIEFMQQRLFVRVASDFAHRLPRFRLDALEQVYGPELVNRWFEVSSLQKQVAALLFDGVAIFMTTLVGLVVLAFYHPLLLAFDALLIVCLVASVVLLGRGGIRTKLAESNLKYQIGAWMEEMARDPRVFKCSGATRLALNRADDLAREYVDARQAHFRILFRQIIFLYFVQVMASTLLLAMGGWLVLNRGLNIGQLVAAELIVALVVSQVAKLGKYYESFYDLATAVEKLGHVTDTPLERTDGELLPMRQGGMSIHVVGSEMGDFEIQPHEKVALIGPAGVGKTRLLDQLGGLRDPRRGTIFLDGIDLRDLRLDAVREQISMVHGREIVSGTIFDNLRMGRTGISAIDIREALRVTGLQEKIHSLPLGMATPLTPMGRPLSNGQAIRLAIARAILAKPRLLILDGVLDRLDLRQCPELLPTLFAADAPWTLIVTTHDPIIAHWCERSIQMDTPTSHSPHHHHSNGHGHGPSHGHGHGHGPSHGPDPGPSSGPGSGHKH